MLPKDNISGILELHPRPGPELPKSRNLTGLQRLAASKIVGRIPYVCTVCTGSGWPPAPPYTAVNVPNSNSESRRSSFAPIEPSPL